MVKGGERLFGLEGASTDVAIQEVAGLLRAPAEFAGIKFKDLSETHFNLYVAAMSTAILTLITDPERLQMRRPRSQLSKDFQNRGD